MTLLTRRMLLAGGAATATAMALPALAATPHSFRHGDFEVTVVSDGHLVLPTSFLAPEAKPEEREALLKAADQSGDSYTSPTNITLVKSGNDLILIDMGSGDRFMPTAGKLWDNLKAAGIDKSTITKVIFTHGHPDHLWGTVDEFDEPMLPDASFHIGQAEWDFWHGDNATRGLPAERAGFVTGARRNYAAIKDRAVMMKDGNEIVPGLQIVSTPGHTQGHVSIALKGREDLIITGDTLTHPTISFAHPEWKTTADHVPELGAATRRKLLDRLAADKAKLIGFHLPYPGVGAVEKKDTAWRFVAA